MTGIKKNSNGHPVYSRKPHKSPEEKVDDLKKALQDLGYTIEETKEGLKVSCSEKK